MIRTRLAFPSICLFALSGLTACFASSTETGNPPAVETALIGVQPGAAEGTVQIAGEPGAITPGGGTVTVTNESTGEQTTVDVAADGSFEAELAGTVDDGYSVSATGPGGTSGDKPIGDGNGDPGAPGDWQTMHACTGDEPSDGVAVEAVAIDGDTLELTVSHGGGCESHDYGLCWEDAWLESFPVQNTVRVLHDAHDDGCQAYLTETVAFDLTPYRQQYADLYRTDFGAISVSVADCAEGASCGVLYDFQCPADSDSCPQGCRPIDAAVVDADAVCVLDTRQPVACVPEDSSQTDDEVCAVRTRDGAVFLSPTGSLLGLGLGSAWEPCNPGQMLATETFCAP